MKRILLLSMAAVLIVSSVTFARGMLIPKDQSLPPLAIKSHRVNVTVDSQLAVTKVVQVFQNNTDRVLEATYIFPLPPGATINDFAMYIDGKRMSGELVEKEKARQVYTEIVRRMKDPGILEYMGGNLLKLNIFPIPANGTQKLEVEYSEVLRRDSGMHRYVYPLKTEGPASQTLEDFTFAMTINSKDPITNVYSPSHEIGKTQKSDREVVLGFEKDKAMLDRDVEVYYAVSDKAFGMNLVTHKPEKDKDGYFMLLITPRYEFQEKDILPRDVCFVLDVSGSMRDDNRLAQAKEALKYCVNSLGEKDRFGVIAFSTTTNALSDKLLDANKENREQAAAFIDKQEPMGGTAIEAALKKSLAMRAEGAKDRPYIIVFLTDGRPTIGTDDIEQLTKIAAPTDATTRIFTWGVGSDVNTHLLDRIAQQTRAVSEYVTPGEQIEAKVSLFFNKLSKPVMAGPKIDWGKMKVHDVHPTELPDLFTGQQLTVFGRYDGTGDVAIALDGKVTGRDEKQTFESTLADGPTNTFVEKLWAARHVGFMLDEIRLHGEKTELKDEVIRLSRTYGIQTPYTSYLVLDSEQAYKDHGIARGTGSTTLGVRGHGGTAGVDGTEKTPNDDLGRRNVPAPSVTRVREDMDRERAADESRPEGQSGGPNYIGPGYRAGEADAKRAMEELRKVSGKEAVEMSKEIARMKSRVTAATEVGQKEDGRATIMATRRVGERTFFLYRGFWVDQNFNEKLPTVEIKYLSDAYFKLLAKMPELKDAFALGERVVIVTGEVAVAIQAEGKEDLTDDELKTLSDGKPLAKE